MQSTLRTSQFKYQMALLSLSKCMNGLDSGALELKFAHWDIKAPLHMSWVHALFFPVLSQTEMFADTLYIVSFLTSGARYSGTRFSGQNLFISLHGTMGRLSPTQLPNNPITTGTNVTYSFWAQDVGEITSAQVFVDSQNVRNPGGQYDVW